MSSILDRCEFLKIGSVHPHAAAPIYSRGLKSFQSRLKRIEEGRTRERKRKKKKKENGWKGWKKVVAIGTSYLVNLD